MADTLETFAPVARTVTVAGCEIAVLPVRMKNLAAFSGGVRPAMPLIMAGNMAGALAAHSDGMVAAVAAATGVDRGFLDDLYPDDFARLAGVVFEVNADFFARRVLPQLRAAAAGLRTAIEASLGAPGSPGSPSADTGSPTSST